MDLAYDGAPFRGFARQREVRTVQGDLEEALGKLFDGDVATVAAGRTDAGVHALGQVVTAADAPDGLDLERTRDALNVMCGPSISVHRCSEARPDFSARFSARSRTYLYAINEGPVLDPFLVSTSLWHRERLDVDAMNEAAGHLIGTHDFISFGRVRETGASAVRNLFELSIARDGQVVRVKARANAFIQQMVRSIVGSLIQIGEGSRAPGEMEVALRARKREAAGPVAPPHGLCLVAVEYDEGWGIPASVVMDDEPKRAGRGGRAVTRVDPPETGRYPALSSEIGPISEPAGR